MKSAIILIVGLFSVAYGARGADIVIEPMPPVGCEVSIPKEGIVHVNMDRPGTVILGRCKVDALPENYIIIYTANGMATELSGSHAALVIYALDDKFDATRAYSGSDLGFVSAKWKGMKTSFLAKAGKQYREIAIGMHCDSPCKVQLRGFKIEAMSRREYDERMDAQLKKLSDDNRKAGQ